MLSYQSNADSYELLGYAVEMFTFQLVLVLCVPSLIALEMRIGALLFLFDWNNNKLLLTDEEKSNIERERERERQWAR